MQICTKCGQQNEPDAEFCTNRDCGAVLAWYGAPAEVPSTDATAMTAIKPDLPAEDRRRPRNVAVHTALSEDAVAVAPGESATTALRVRNQGTIVDQFSVQVTGPVGQWAHCEPSSINLYPDGDDTVTIRFAPPRGPQPPAGTMPFWVRVTSSQDASVSETDGGMVTVAPYQEIISELAPETGRGRRSAAYDLTTVNQGNTPVDLTVEAHDPDQRLTCAVAAPTFQSVPGGANVTAIDVRAKERHWIGSPQQHPLTITAARPDDSARTRVLQRQAAFQQKAIFPYWLLALLVLLLILGILAFIFLRSDTAEVPDVIGRAEADARERLENAGLDVARDTEGSDEPEGTVLAQDPAAGATLEIGEQVTITVAVPEEIAVPDLNGRSQDAAGSDLETAGLALGEVVVEQVGFDDERNGTVIEQDPEADATVPAGSEIDITVAASDIREVPELSGQSEGTAQSTLSGAGLRLGTVTQQPSDSPEGTVIAQNPEPGNEAAADSAVDITVAVPMENGTDVTVPPVEGATLEDAATDLEDSELTTGARTQREIPVSDAELPSGTVVDQDPAGGTIVAPGTEVALEYSASVVSDGELLLRRIASVDLDAGLLSAEPPDLDVIWDVDLIPDGAAELADLETPIFNNVTLLDLHAAEFTADPVGFDDLTQDRVIALLTNDGNLTKIRIAESPHLVGSDEMVITWVTYESIDDLDE